MYTLRRRDPERRMARFYRCQLQGQLDGGVTLVREWGSIGSPGQVKADRYPDEQAAVLAAERLTLAKRRKGYV